MKISTLAAALVALTAGCTATDSPSTASTSAAAKNGHDLTKVCMTADGVSVSEGTIRDGKTCSKPDHIMVVPAPTLVWR